MKKLAPLEETLAHIFALSVAAIAGILHIVVMLINKPSEKD